MSILTENIKLYNPFGNRQVLVNYILFLFYIIMVYATWFVVKANGNTLSLKNMYFVGYFVSLFAMFLFGNLSSKMHLEIITKPFSSCLPDQYKNTGITILLTGVIGNIFYSSICFIMFYNEGMLWPHYFLNIFFTGLSVFYLPVVYFLFIKNEYKKYVVFAGTIIFYIPINSFFEGDIQFNFSEYISSSIIPLIFITLFMMFAIYMGMTRPWVKRIYFSGKSPFSFEPVDPKSAPKINEALRINKLSEKKFKPGIFERFFLKALKNTKYFSDFRTIIAKEYCSLDKFFTLTGWYSWIIILTGLFLITAVLLLSGYTLFSVDDTISFFILKYVLLYVGILFVCYKVVSGFVPVYHNLLLPVGRHRQFWNNLYLFLIQIALAVLWLVVVVLISWLIKKSNTLVPVDNTGFFYDTLGLSILIWPIVFIPALNIFLYYFNIPCSSITMMTFMAILLNLTVFSISEANRFHASTAMALAIVISNGFFLIRLCRYWFKKDIELLD